MVSILLLVSGVLLLVEALIYSLLMTPTPNRTLSKVVLTFLSQHGSGFSQDRSND
jgi:phage terminase large subunit-like protein